MENQETIQRASGTDIPFQVHTLFEIPGSTPGSAISCKQCSKGLTKRQRKDKCKFCSSSCSAKFNNKGLTRWKVERHCKICSVKLSQRRKYCDIHSRKGGFRTFEELKHIPTIKRWLLEERGHKCESCNLTEWLGQQIVLTLDHIDGNSDNHSKENLRLICWNCHALTPTFGAKNIGRHPESKRNRAIRLSRIRNTSIE